MEASCAKAEYRLCQLVQTIQHSLLLKLRLCLNGGEASPTFGHANANFSVFIDRFRNQFLKK